MLAKVYSSKSTIAILVVSAFIMGISLFFKLPIALYPQASKPEVYFGVPITGTSSEEFYENFGKDIESSAKGLKNVLKVEGKYQSGRIRYTVTFDWGVDSETAKSEVEKMMASYRSRFPADWGDVWYWFGGGEGSMVIYTAYSEKYSVSDLEKLLRDKVLPRANQIEGLSEVWMAEVNKKYVKVILNPKNLLHYGVSAKQVRLALSKHELDASIGKIEQKSGSDYKISVAMQKDKLDELGDIVVSYDNGAPVRIRQISSIKLETVLPKRFWKSEGKRSLMAGAIPSIDANISQVSLEFKKIFEEAAAEVSKDIIVKPMLDPSTFINAAVKNVGIAIAIGVLAATLVILIFLQSIQSTLIIAFSIPLCLIGGVILMFAFGIELNLISLGAMALASGMVVDGSIVVIENIFRHLRSTQALTRTKLESVVIAVREVVTPVIASAITTMVVFLPMMFTAPIAAAILGDLAKVIVSVLAVSVVVTIFVIPVLALWLIPKDYKAKSSPVWISMLTGVYERLLKKILRSITLRKTLVAVTFGLFLGASWVLVYELEQEVMPRPDSDKLFLFINYKQQEFEFEKSEQIIDNYEKVIREEFGDYLKSTLTQIRKNRSAVLCFLKDKSQINEFKKLLEERFVETPQLRFNVWPWSPTALDIPNPPAIDIAFNGLKEDEIRELQRKIRNELSGIKSKGRTRLVPRYFKEDKIRLHPKDNQTVKLVMEKRRQDPQSFLMDEVGYLLNERKAMDLHLDDKSLEVKVSYPENYISSPADIKNQLVRIGDDLMPLRALTTFEHTRQWGQFQTLNGNKEYSFKVWPRLSYEGSKERFRSGILSTIQGSENIPLENVSFLDSDKEIRENLASLGIALLFAIIAVLLVINIQFSNLMLTSIVLLAIPLGLIGVSASLWIFSTKLSINSMLGLILLSGTAVNNSILMVDFFVNESANKSKDIMERVLSAAKLRFRPILITTLTTVLGMLPIAFRFGEGGEVLQPLGIAVCGGLGVSTLFTLFIVPVFLSFVPAKSV